MMATGDGKPMLTGIKVVDLTTVVFGPYATHILATMGADVIKVEPPGGDVLRNLTRPAITPGMSPAYFALCHDKQSIVLDVKTPEDAAVMRALLAEADVFVLNVRGAAAARVGLDYDSVKAINPDIIYAHCVGFGQSGPYADLRAYDDVIQAATGTTTLLPRVDGNPQPRYLPSLIADKVAGLHAAYAILGAVIHRMRTGRGQCVEIPMLESFANFMLIEHLAGQTFDPPVGNAGYGRQIDPNRQPFPTSDGHVSIVIYNASAFPIIIAILQAEHLLKDERFAEPAKLLKNVSAFYAEMAKLTIARTTADLVTACQAAGLPAQPVRDINDMLNEPHLAATGFFKSRTHPSEGGYVEMQPPVSFSDAPVRESASPQTLNQASDAIRARLKTG